jgi:secreted trypsin-like serine protease
VSLNAKQGIPAIGDEVNTIGFGYTNETSYKPSNVLRQVKLDIFNDYICSLVYFIYRPRTMICAGTVKGGRGNCYGDSGGPLLTSDGVQVGIVSFGYGCANPSIPTGYTDVRPFLKNWIQPMICELSKNPPSYC